MMMKWQLKLSLALLSILPILFVPSPAGAEAPPERQSLTPEVLLPSHPELLSGGAWLALTGQDPALSLDPRIGGGGVWQPPDVTLQAAGAGAAALIPYRDPAPKFSRNILVSRDEGRLPFQTWPNMAVHPRDPEHIAMVLVDYNFPGISSYVSIDGGATWEGPHQPRIPLGERTGVGDPVVDFDRQGDCYAAQMSVRFDQFTVAGLVGFALVASIPVSISTDGGFTWEESIIAARGGVEAEELGVDEMGLPRGRVATYFQDKPWIVTGPHPDYPDDPDKDVIYVTYTSFIDVLDLRWLGLREVPVLVGVGRYTVIEVVSSEDGGRTWSEPTQVSPVTDTMVARHVVQGSYPVVGPDGTLHVAWYDSTPDGVWTGEAEIWIASSQDMGRTFDPSVLVDTFQEVDFSPRSAHFRLWATGMPKIAMGPGEELYIAYAGVSRDDPEDEGDIFVVRSFDGGSTWDPSVRVNDDDTGRLQFFPAITVDPHGDVHLMWGDMRDDPGELRYHIYYSSSHDQGKTWEVNSRVSDFPSNPNFAFPRGRYIGDFFDIAATEDDVYIAWSDSRLGEVVGLSQKVAFARRQLIPAASIFLSPPSGPAGRDIIIRGHHFQPDTEIFIDVAGVLTATGRTTEDGTFAKTIFAPVTGEGAQSVVVRDISGNVATASFYTEFGFDSLREGLRFLEQELRLLVEDRRPLQEDPPPPELEGRFLWLVVALPSALAGALLTLGILWCRNRRRIK